jgi:hypothetical protein
MRPLLAILVLASCGPAPDLVSSHGVEYHYLSGVSPWDPAELEVIEDEYLACVQPILPVSIADVRVHVYSAPFPCLAVSSDHCNGIEQWFDLHVVDLTGSPRGSALRHEMIHWALSAHGLGEDYYHQHAAFAQCDR